MTDERYDLLCENLALKAGTPQPATARGPGLAGRGGRPARWLFRRTRRLLSGMRRLG